jgi:hypothetical protein
MKTSFSTMLLVATVGLSGIGNSQDPAPAATPDANKATGASATPAPTPATGLPKPKASSLDALFRLVPIGRTHEGVRYPVMENGSLTSNVTSERMTRLDENSLRFEKAVIDQKGTDPLTFHLESAVYNRSSDLLLSNQPARIDSKTYQIEGDSLSYDRKSSVARMDGRVRMIIFDLDSMQAPGATTEAAVADPKKPVKDDKAAKGNAKTPAASTPAPAPASTPAPAEKSAPAK